MKIDRTNYEVWLTDWLDGNLNSAREEEMKLFLHQNPDLEEELNDFSSAVLTPSHMVYDNKQGLKKDITEIPVPQFEYLCAAWMENDLSESQEKELEEIVDMYPELKQIHRQMINTRLAPEKVIYGRKKLLLKEPLFRRVIRLSAAGTGSAAAVVLVLIAFYFLRPKSAPVTGNSAKQYEPESGQQMPPAPAIHENTGAIAGTVDPVRDKPVDRTAVIKKKDITYLNETVPAPAEESTEGGPAGTGSDLNKVPVASNPELGKLSLDNSLILPTVSPDAMSAVHVRSQAGKFISRTFRQRLLKEKVPDDRPLKGYEIAEAGVSGLNKILGWQMALEMNSDAAGQPKSIYFRSKILKVKAPVKKREEQP